MLDLSIIVVNWNTRQMLAKCLNAIKTTTKNTAYEIIVVDNASTDGSQAMVRQEFPDVQLIANTENVGFAKANNQAAPLTQGMYILLLNSDAFVHDNALDRLVAFMNDHPEAGAAGCRLLYEDGALQRSCTAFPTLSTELWTAVWLDKLFASHPFFGKYQMTYWDMNDVRDVDSIMGACLMLRRKAIEENGLFDERFFMYSEEVDLCFRLKQAKWKIYFVPDAEATHIWWGTARKIQTESFLRMYRSRVIFFRKHYGELTTLLYKLVLLLSSILRVTLGPISFAIRRNRNLVRIYQNYWMLLRSVHTF